MAPRSPTKSAVAAASHSAAAPSVVRVYSDKELGREVEKLGASQRPCPTVPPPPHKQALGGAD
jgi:hypothetical protein